MGGTAPLRLPDGAEGAADDAATKRIGHWIERLIAAGVEPRCELLLAGEGLADAALARFAGAPTRGGRSLALDAPG